MLILVIVLVIVAIPLVLASRKPDSFEVKRVITIAKPRHFVFDYIGLMKNQDNYSVWMMLDPAMVKTFTGVDGEIGFESHWVSKNKKVGEGKQRIIAIEKGKRMDFEIQFIKPWENKANAFMQLEELAANATRVTWAFTGQANFGMKVMHVFMNMDKMLGKDLERGLSNLKRILENKN